MPVRTFTTASRARGARRASAGRCPWPGAARGHANPSSAQLPPVAGRAFRGEGCAPGRLLPLLEVLTQCMDLESAPADDGAGQAEEGFVDIVTDLPADAQPPEPVQQRDGLFHHVPVDTKARAVR